MPTSNLRKALGSTEAAALIPYDLDPVLEEELLGLQPLATLLDIIPAGGKTHEYSLRTSHPQGWFEGESTPANNKNSTYVRKSVALKIQRVWGSVTGFGKAVTAPFIDAFATELEGSVEGMSNLMEYGCLYGCADDIGFSGDAYQYSGIVSRLFAYAPGNVIDAGGDKITLADLDSAIAKATAFRGVRSDPKLWLMSFQMKQVTDGLQSKVQIPLTSVTLADGAIQMAAYSGIPILESDYMQSTLSTSPACTAVVAAGAGLADGTYKYSISSITVTGEMIPGTVSADVVAGAGSNQADLTWTHDDNAVLYYIWRKKDAGGYQLIDIIPALTYDAAGTVNGNKESYKDTGKTAKAVKPLAAGEQNILLINRNPNRGAAFVGLVDDMGQPVDRLLSFVDLARTKDSFDYMLKSYLALRLKHPNLISMVRHAKLA